MCAHAGSWQPQAPRTGSRVPGLKLWRAAVGVWVAGEPGTRALQGDTEADSCVNHVPRGASGSFMGPEAPKRHRAFFESFFLGKASLASIRVSEGAVSQTRLRAPGPVSSVGVRRAGTPPP